MTKRTCSVDGCPEPHHAKGYCGMHWQRVKKYGDPGEAEKLPTSRYGLGDGGEPRPKKTDFQHGTPHGYNYHKCRCNECAEWARSYARRYYAQNPEAAAERRAQPERKKQLRDGHLRRNYKLEPEQFLALLESQGNRCANPACGATEPGSIGSWCVDHDHSCCETTPICGNCIRGLLCWNCNVAAGHLRDDPDIVDGLAAYLRRGPLS